MSCRTVGGCCTSCGLCQGRCIVPSSCELLEGECIHYASYKYRELLMLLCHFTKLHEMRQSSFIIWTWCVEMSMLIRMKYMRLFESSWSIAELITEHMFLSRLPKDDDTRSAWMKFCSLIHWNKNWMGLFLVIYGYAQIDVRNRE